VIKCFLLCLWSTMGHRSAMMPALAPRWPLGALSARSGPTLPAGMVGPLERRLAGNGERIP
jgi:hypothetical protein